MTDSYYCIARAGCGCPPGQEYVGPPTEMLDGTPTPALAVTGGQDGERVTIDPVKRRCEPRKPKPPPPGVPRCPRITAPYQVCIVLEGSGMSATP